MVIPADSDGTKLDELASDPSAYYELLDSRSMHLVRFPRQSMTAYGFFEAVETPEDELIRTANQPAALIVQELEEDGTGAQAETPGETGDEEQEETAGICRCGSPRASRTLDGSSITLSSLAATATRGGVSHSSVPKRIR